MMELAATKQCPKCKHVPAPHNSSEFFLPLYINKAQSLEKCLDHHLVEELQGVECEECKRKSDQKRTHNILNAPENIFISLKRYNANSSKNNSEVKLEPILNLNKFRGPDNKASLRYELASVIHHMGRGVNSGHYICYAAGPDGAWNLYDDDRMTKSSVHQAVEHKRRGGSAPYVLFYRRMAD